MARIRNGTAEYIKLEQRLVMLAWLNGHFGYKSNRDLLADMKGAREGFDASGRSDIFRRLEAQGDKIKIPLADLARYEDHIHEHLRAMNARRPEPIRLRYFQHLAVLYTEIFLDWYFHRRGEMLHSLNLFVDTRNASKPPSEAKDAKFSESDLKKLAFWMATGSGKTLIIHINYRQFLHFNDLPLDNILLITPNEGLSDQHMAEMAASDIPCRRFDLNESGLMASGKHSVRVIEITKLVQEKRGGGVSVPVEAFEGNNLIFVDEGHKGSGGEAWRSFREALGDTGFTFEYSATFGQALKAVRSDRLTAEYGKAIIFDYSYRYFHGDGYGKDFRILNLREETTEDKTETLLLGNLLSFYEQQRVFEEQTEALRPYNLEKPLCVFVGHSVKNPKSSASQDDRTVSSDVLNVARFLHHFLQNSRGWAVRTIQKLLEGKSGLVTDDGDVFEGKFEYLRETGTAPGDVYRGILTDMLHAPAGGALHLCDMRGSPGELGLKAGGAEEYFGLIYIGDTGTFKKFVEEDDSGITLEEDAVAGSLFDGINEPGTSIDILIGAKKFMEGWNSWRVSNMGLLNIGRKEGSEIIQLFGRGVRLRGRGFTLKRSSALDGTHPYHIGLMETLNIFAVRANYMTVFRNYLEREGVETEGDIELPIPIRPNEDFLGRGLVVPRVPEDRSFAEEADILLAPDPSLRVRVDMSLKVQALESGAEGVTSVEAYAGRDVNIPAASLDLVDWEKVYLDLLEYKERKGLANLAINPETPKNILATTEPTRLYTLVADESVVTPDSFAGTTLLHDAVLAILRKYVDGYYRARRERWDSQHMVYQALDENDPNLSFNRSTVREREFSRYVVKVTRSESELISAIQKLIDDVDRLYEEETGKLLRIHFDRHLYQPLLVEREDKVRMVPPGLTESEARFVSDLKEYWAVEKDVSLAGTEVFLLRNLSRGSGIGFFEERGFYPDFILWIIESRRQHIIFVEPHGMLHAGTYSHDEKARLHESLPGLAGEIAARSGSKSIYLDSYIVSTTPYHELHTKYCDGKWNRKKFADAHILFFERSDEYDYMKMLFAEQLARWDI